MKIIVSHDVDHLSIKEHLIDRYFLGLVYKSALGIIRGERFSLRKRFALKTENIKELRLFNQSMGVRETYFFATRKGLSLSYDYREAQSIITWLLQEGIEVGLHGQSPDSLDGLKEEYSRLKEIHSGEIIGIRNHYLRKTENTLEIMGKVGFQYDSTFMELKAPFKSGSIWEIPISVMDVSVLSSIANNEVSVWEKTIQLINEAESKQLPYFVINFHDVYFSEGWPSHRNWYIKLITHLKDRGFHFISFNQALEELKQGK